MIYSTGYAPDPTSPGWGARGHHRETQGVRKKNRGFMKGTLIYHNNVDEVWHVGCGGHQIETQNPSKTGGVCTVTPIDHDNGSQFRQIDACVEFPMEGWYHSASKTSW